ncbi:MULTISPECIES: hypothetical protein [Micromonospora]|nr:hypothetical protein [Micromonospora sp. Mcm103]
MAISDQHNRRFAVPQHSAIAVVLVVGAFALLAVAPAQAEAVATPITCC